VKNIMITATQDERAADQQEPELKESPVEILLGIASSVRLCRSSEGCLCAEFPAGERSEIAELKSSKFRDWLIDGYFHRQGRAPSAWAIRRVQSTLEARAGAKLPSVFVRVGGDRGRPVDGPTYYLDLGDTLERTVKIQRVGWAVVDRPPVRFRRPEGHLPLPLPSPTGSIDLLRPYVNLSEPDFRLLIVWLTSALRPAGPYPILALCGEQGSGKSTLTKLVRLLIDPQACALLTQPRSTRELVSNALNRWLLAYDNLSVIRDWLSDSLCRLADGAGFLTQRPLSGDPGSVIQVQRPVVLNGIDDFVRRGDLGDRCVVLHLPPVQTTRRRSEHEFWASFQYDYPRILGALLDALAGGMRVLPDLDLTSVQRMADFAYWGEAAGRGLQWAPGIFSRIYRDNVRDASERALDDSTVGGAVLALAHSLRRWSGTTTELHSLLSRIVGEEIAASARWPKTVSALAKELRRIAGWLRTQGLSVRFEKKAGPGAITLTTDDEHEQSDSGTPRSAPLRSLVQGDAGRRRRAEVRFR
jgi:hypothetical protein